MAAPMKKCSRIFQNILTGFRSSRANKGLHGLSEDGITSQRNGRQLGRLLGSAAVLGVGVAALKRYTSSSSHHIVNAEQQQQQGIAAEPINFSGRPALNGQPWHYNHPPTKQMRHAGGNASELKLTLYQFATCPFCCKVRAYLDYFGIDYDVIEVDSITRKQKKWTSFKKVPILTCDGIGSDGFLQVNDSSVIVSLLESYKVTHGETSIDKMSAYYPCIESREGRKTIYEFPNKYFIMYGDTTIPEKSMAELREEREWRAWVDDTLVHIISPNAYRTLPEAIRTFKWFSEVGDWKDSYQWWSRHVCIYLGATVMWAIGGRLKRKYGLNDDVRVSFYNAINDWMQGIGKSRKFMGGDKPNLADLGVYGILCSIEGCQAFEDLMANTDLARWYEPMKEAVTNHHGNRMIRSEVS